MDSHVQRNTASLAEVMSAELAAKLVDFCVFFSHDGHLGDGGVGHDIAVLRCMFVSQLRYIHCLFLVVDRK